MDFMVLETLKEGERYRHYKGSEYVIICEATCVETKDTQIVYRSISDGKVYVRDKLEFLGIVEVSKPQKAPRFERIG